MVPCGGGSPCPGLPPSKIGVGQCARGVVGVPARRAAGSSELGVGEVYGISSSCGSVYASCFVRSPRVRRDLGAALVCASFPL